MADQRADEQSRQSGTAMKRRGIFAAAAAVGVGFVARSLPTNGALTALDQNAGKWFKLPIVCGPYRCL